VDRVRAGSLGDVDDLRLVEVRFAGGCRTDVVRLASVLDVAGVAVGVAIDGHRLDTEFFARCHHANCNFAAIGDEYFLEHGQ